MFNNQLKVGILALSKTILPKNSIANNKNFIKKIYTISNPEIILNNNLELVQEMINYRDQ